MTDIRIGLIRHGRTAWNLQGRLQGRTDIPLEDAERERIAALTFPDAWQSADLLASPLSRARETARLLADTEPRVDERLVEMDLGDWEGQRGEDLLQDPESGFAHIEDWGWDYQPPGGETLRGLWKRVDDALSEITRDTVIVSHMGVMRVILARAHGWDFDSPAPFKVKRDRIFMVTRQSNGGLTPDEAKPVRLVSRCA